MSELCGFFSNTTLGMEMDYTKEKQNEPDLSLDEIDAMLRQ